MLLLLSWPLALLLLPLLLLLLLLLQRTARTDRLERLDVTHGVLRGLKAGFLACVEQLAGELPSMDKCII